MTKDDFPGNLVYCQNYIGSVRLFNYLALILVKCMGVCMPPCLYNLYVDVHGGQKRASDPWELELQAGVSHHVGLGAVPWSYARAAGGLIH